MVSASVRSLVGNETLELRLWSRWIVRGGVGRMTELGRYTWRLVCLHALFGCCLLAGTATEREGERSMGYIRSSSISSFRRQLTSPESPPGERGLSGYTRRCIWMINPRPAVSLSVPSSSTHHPACVSNPLTTPPTPRAALRQRAQRCHEPSHEVRPGALTRPRRRRPTIRRDAKTPVLLSPDAHNPPSTGPETTVPARR